MAMKTRFNPGAFALASLAAPAISVVVFMVGLVVAGFFREGAVGLPPVGGFILIALMFSLWGWIPSAVFGGRCSAFCCLALRRPRGG